MAIEAAKNSLSARPKSALIDLLYRLADDCLIIGHRSSEWTGLGPILEADIAFSSMAQDKMGHALAMYRLLQELGEPDPDTLAFSRGPEQYRCCSLVVLPRGDWAFSVVRQFFFDETQAVRLEALAKSRYEPLAHLARKLRGEIKYHVMHGRTWVRRLGSATDESHCRMQAAVDQLFPHALGVFEPTQWDDVLASEGVQPKEAEFCERWRAAIDPILAEASLEAPVEARPVYGGRSGRHPGEIADLLKAMQKVYRLDPTARW